MRTLAAVAVSLLVYFAVCSHKPRPNVTDVSDDDPRMNAAIENARSTVPTFAAALRAPKPSQSGFAVKTKFTDGDGAEHMWLSSVTFDGTSFHGAVGNDPDELKNVKMGQQASVEASKISDWMYIENGKLVGGHTVRVLREIMTPDERERFDRTAPFRID